MPAGQETRVFWLTSCLCSERELPYRVETTKYYSQCLALGTKYIYQALPRMLTIWFEFGDEVTVLEAIKAKKKSVSSPNASTITLTRITFRNAAVNGKPYEYFAAFTKINKTVNRSVKGIPLYDVSVVGLSKQSSAHHTLLSTVANRSAATCLEDYASK